MRYYYHRKATADESCKLRISYLRERGLLSGEEAVIATGWKSSMTGKETTVVIVAEMSDDLYITLIYSTTDREGNKTDHTYQVPLETTPCYYGGERYWFSCPDCWSRVAV